MADVEVHFHGGPLHGEARPLDESQTVFSFLDDVSGQCGEYARERWCHRPGRCFTWRGWQRGWQPL